MILRGVLRKVLLVTGSTAVAASALAALGVPSRRAVAESPIPLGPQPARLAVPWRPSQSNGTDPPPQQTDQNVVDPDDPAMVAGPVTFGGAAGDVYGYLAQPAGDGPFAGIIVIHENRGLIEPYKDIARRYAKEGYAALAVDLASRAGGTDALLDDPMQITGVLGQASPDDLVSDTLSGLAWLADQSFVDANRLGATGFCFGGGIIWRLTTAAPILKAAVPYYGSNPPLELVPNISAAVLGIYAELDTRTTSNSDTLYAALDAAGVVHDRWIAPGAAHAFFNNTGSAYNPAGAMEAWHRTLAWFGQYLSG